MLTKPYAAADVLFLDRMLGQLEKKLKLARRIGIEVLIEEVQALQNVEEISKCSDRLECLIFGMGDYSGSQGIDTREIGARAGHRCRRWSLFELQERGRLPRRGHEGPRARHGR